MDYNEFVKSAQAPQPVYLLVTEQAFLKDKVLDFCLQQVTEAARPFDWSVHNLDEGNVQEVISRARTLPWMSPRRWVYVRNAHLGEELLKAYLEAPVDRTVVVLEVPKPPKSWPKLTTIELKVGDRAPAWIEKKFRSEKIAVSQDAVGLLLELVGDDLLALESEIEKLISWVGDNGRVDTEDVLALVGEARQHTVFELSEALGLRQREKALNLLANLFDAGAEPISIVGLLYHNFKRLLVARERLNDGHKYFDLVRELNLWSFKSREREVRKFSPELLRDILLRLREADRLFKSSGADPRIHLERLIVDTCRTTSL